MLQVTLLLVCVFGACLALPMQIGILASNSNEILRLNGITLATLGQTQLQGSPVLPQYVFQQRPEVLYAPQLLNYLHPQTTGAFGPQGPQLLVPGVQGNQLGPAFLPNAGHQERLGPQDPNAAVGPPQQPPNPMIPQFQYPVYSFPQQPRMQGFPYYLAPYGYPQQSNTVPLQPNYGQVSQVHPTLEKTTQKPQLPLQQVVQPKTQGDKTRLVATQKETATVPPGYRGDADVPGIDEVHSNFPFLFEP